MRLLAESSAVMAWLLNEPKSAEVARLLGLADEILTSNLTWIECERVLHRCAALGTLPVAELVDSRKRLLQASVSWISVEISAECQQKARNPFPVEPLRTLDALHVATALIAREWVGELQVLTLDQRVRENAVALGFLVIP